MDYDKCVQGKGGKTILVIGCVHGNELIGQRIINKLRHIIVSNGTLITLIANIRAVERKKRFIEKDLNRSFPGNKKGCYEERLAQMLLPLIRKADIVLDIHSTTTNITSVIILTKVNQSIRNLLSIFIPKRVVVMESKLSKTALTRYCKAGISFEYGKDKSEKAYKETLADILRILEEYKMIKKNKKEIPNLIHKTKYFQVVDTMPRLSGFKLKKTVKNFSLIRRGDVVAQNRKRTQKAQQDFYPFLFREKAYKNTWGFISKKVKTI